MLTAPSTAINSATTTNVYVRRSASRTIHMVHLRTEPVRDGSTHRADPPLTTGTSTSLTGRGRQEGCQRPIPQSATRVRVWIGETYTDKKVRGGLPNDPGRPSAAGYEICPSGPRITTAIGLVTS